MVEKKQIDWSSLGFGYQKTDYRFVANYRNGGWEEGFLSEDENVVINECAGVLQYSQSCFEGLKAYTTEDGHIVTFRPDLNAQRMKDSCERLEMPVYPVDQWVDAVCRTVKANAAWVAPYGSGATLYIRPYMFGSNAVIGVKPADEYQFRILTTPVGPYFKGGVKPITIRISDFDRAAPHGTGHIKAGLNYAMSLHAITGTGSMRICTLTRRPGPRLRKPAERMSCWSRKTVRSLFRRAEASFPPSPAEAWSTLRRRFSE